MTNRLRWSGIVPLCFFAAHWYHHVNINQGQQILWLCNLNNLLLGTGLILNVPLLFQAGILWLIPTLPLWFIESWGYQDFPVTSILSHAGAVVFGCLLLKRVGMDRRAWIPALLWALFVQIVCRIFTSPTMNINVSHAVYPGWAAIFPHYWEFWIFVAIEASAGLMLLARLLHRYFPSDRGNAGKPGIY